jgi:hypothetical protein
MDLERERERERERKIAAKFSYYGKRTSLILR